MNRRHSLLEDKGKNGHGMIQYARDVRKYSFAVRVVDRWIQLPESVRMTQGKEAFNSSVASGKQNTERRVGQG
jgi:hypothetical protein